MTIEERTNAILTRIAAIKQGGSSEEIEELKVALAKAQSDIAELDSALLDAEYSNLMEE